MLRLEGRIRTTAGTLHIHTNTHTQTLVSYITCDLSVLEYVHIFAYSIHSKKCMYNNAYCQIILLDKNKIMSGLRKVQIRTPLKTFGMKYKLRVSTNHPTSVLELSDARVYKWEQISSSNIFSIKRSQKNGSC